MKIPRFVVLTHALLGFALTSLPAQTPTPAQAAPPAPGAVQANPAPSAPEPTPTPTFGDKRTQSLPDRRVTFRFFAPKANAVSVLVGLKSGVDEAQGTTTTAMTKGANGLWTATLGPFEPNLYEYGYFCPTPQKGKIRGTSDRRVALRDRVSGAPSRASVAPPPLNNSRVCLQVSPAMCFGYPGTW